MPRRGMGSKVLPPMAVPMDDGRREYGDATRDIEAQEAVPMGAPPSAIPDTPGRMPGDAGPFDRMTEQPSVPVTDGSPLGPGRGPEALAFAPDNLRTMQSARMYEQVHTLAEQTRDPALMRLLNRLEQ